MCGAVAGGGQRRKVQRTSYNDKGEEVTELVWEDAGGAAAEPGSAPAAPAAAPQVPGAMLQHSQHSPCKPALQPDHPRTCWR